MQILLDAISKYFQNPTPSRHLRHYHTSLNSHITLLKCTSQFPCFTLVPQQPTFNTIPREIQLKTRSRCPSALNSDAFRWPTRSHKLGPYCFSDLLSHPCALTPSPQSAWPPVLLDHWPGKRSQARLAPSPRQACSQSLPAGAPPVTLSPWPAFYSPSGHSEPPSKPGSYLFTVFPSARKCFLTSPCSTSTHHRAGR